MSMHQALLAPPLNQTAFVWIESLELSPHLIDRLADAQQDWISHLPDDWEVDLHPMGLTGELQLNNLSGATVTDLIALVRHTSLQPVTIAAQTHWCYTCCVRLVGIGRIRLVLSFHQAQPEGNYTALATNRLDWSPRTVITHWQQQLSDLGNSTGGAIS